MYIHLGLISQDEEHVRVGLYYSNHKRAMSISRCISTFLSSHVKPVSQAGQPAFFPLHLTRGLTAQLTPCGKIEDYAAGERYLDIDLA